MLPGLCLLEALTAGSTAVSDWNLQISWTRRGSGGDVLGAVGRAMSVFRAAVSDRWLSSAILSQ